MKKVGEIVLMCFAIGGIIGFLDAKFTKEYSNPVVPLYILIMVCAIGFLILADKE